MKQTFTQLLTKWNDGEKGRAQKLFAKKIGVSAATVGRWMNGKNLPDESIRRAVAKELKIKMEDLMDSFKLNYPATPDDVVDIEKEFSELERKYLEQIKATYFYPNGLRNVKNADVFRWMTHAIRKGSIPSLGQSPVGDERQPIVEPLSRAPQNNPKPDQANQPATSEAQQVAK